MTEAYERFGQDKLWGRFDLAGWNRLSQFMLAAKQIDKPFDAAKLELHIPDLYQRISHFDAEAVKASARACKF